MISKTTMLLLILLLAVTAAQAGPVSTAFTYQGRLVLDGVPVTGSVDLQFYLYDAEVSGTQISGGYQFQDVAVDKGVFSVLLDWAALNWNGDERWLEIYVRNPHDPSNPASGFLPLDPRQRITVVPYAIHALNGGGSGGSGFWSANGPNISNTNSGFVGIGRNTTVTPAEVFGLQAPGNGFAGMYIKSDSPSGQPFYGYKTPSYLSYHYIEEATGLWRFYHNTNYLNFSSTGNLGVDMLPNTSKIAASGVIESTTGGFKFPDGTVQTTAGGGASSAEEVVLSDSAANTTIEVKASTSGVGTSGGPILNMYNTTGQRTFYVFGGNTSGSTLYMRNTANASTISMISNYTSGAGGLMEIQQNDGGNAIRMAAHGGFGQNTNGPEIRLHDVNSNASLWLYGDYNGTGESRVIANVVEITGGSDLSEQFDIAAGALAIEPGAVVSIDPDSPGDLRLSTEAYDRKVAGIVSGADGIKPGLLMGQKGSEADGEHPVALTGRVYCKVDASFGSIEPGDLLTTSPNPGHAMKVSDHDQALGAILGKAMTTLDSGQGLVLVLVSLQ
jgi:hypothetical protein